MPLKRIDPYTPDGFHRLLFSSIVGAAAGSESTATSLTDDTKQWLSYVLATIYTLYGSVPMAVLTKVYNQRRGAPKTALDLAHMLQQIPAEAQTFALSHGEIYDKHIAPDTAAAIVWNRRDVDFFIPPKEVIEHADLGMIAFVPMDRLSQTLSDLLDITVVSEGEVLQLWQSVLMMLAASESIEHIVTAVANLHFVTSPREIKQLEGLLAMWNDIVPKWRNAGHSDEALRRINVL